MSEPTRLKAIAAGAFAGVSGAAIGIYAFWELLFTSDLPATILFATAPILFSIAIFRSARKFPVPFVASLVTTLGSIYVGADILTKALE